MKEERLCFVCGDNFLSRKSTYEGEYFGKILCNRHSLQIKRNGKITNPSRSTKRDKRICFICGDGSNVNEFGSEGKYRGKLICGRHATQIRTFGDIKDTFKRNRSEIRECEICGNTEKTKQAGFETNFAGMVLCVKHYDQMRLHGKIIDSNKTHKDRERICEHPECNSTGEVFYSRKSNQMLCRRHWDHVYLYGRILERTVFDRNEIIVCNDYAEIIMYNSKQEETKRAKIDLEDVDKVKNHKWRLGSWGYAETNLKENGEIISVMLQNLLIKPNKKETVDHIDRDPLNNRKYNLRIVNKSLNAVNADIRENNTSGVTGVSYIKRMNTWRVYINYQGKRIELGNRKNYDDAVKLRLEAELKYYPDHPPQKHLFEEYGIKESE